MGQLTEREWVIGLYDYRAMPSPANVFSDFNELVKEELLRLGLEVSYVGIEGDGYSGKAQKANGAAYKRLVESAFTGITVLNLICNPPQSDEPAYDRFVSASLSITPYDDNLLVMSVNDGIVHFGSESFLRILKRLSNLHDWSSGYALVDLVAKQPEFHVMGLDDGNLSDDELQRLTKWYCSTSTDKMKRIRSVYPFNLLNSDQLAQQLKNGETLGQFAESHAGSTLTKDGYRGLTLWAVPEDGVNAVRELLGECDVVIA